MPLAITIPTAHGDVGVVHADVPHPTWSEATEVFEAGDPWAVDVALLGLAAPAPAIREHQSRGVAGLRALVHGHEAGRTVRRTANRWNIDNRCGECASQPSDPSPRERSHDSCIALPRRPSRREGALRRHVVVLTFS